MSSSARSAVPVILCAVFTTRCRALRSFAVLLPNQTRVTEDALNCASVEVAEDYTWHAKLPQPSQEIQTLPGFPHQVCDVVRPGEILRDFNSEKFKCGNSLHLSLSNVINLLCFAGVTGEITVLAPLHKVSHLPPVY